MKRLISSLLAFCLMFTVMALPAAAAQTPDVTVNHTTGVVTMEVTGDAGDSVTVKIERDNKIEYLDSTYLDDTGKYVFETKLPLHQDYQVTINADGVQDTQSITTKPVASPDAATAYQATQQYILRTVAEPQVSSIGGEWAVLGLARAGVLVPKDYYEAYYDKVVSYTNEKINPQEQLHRNKSTDNSRVILALTSICKDPTNVGGHNLLKGITDMNYLKKQGINGPIWALIAFDSKNYEIPAAPDGAEQVSRESLVDHILQQRHDDGGWSLSEDKTEASMVDITAMAIASLAPYYESNADVKTAVDGAISLLSKLQQSDGGYHDMDDASSESSAQVIVALTSVGIDPHTDSRFVKNGKSVVDSLCSFAVEGGGFRHTMTGERNAMASEQGLYALAAYFRFVDGQNRLYDMSDAAVNVAPENPVPPTEPDTKPTEPGTKPTDPQTKPTESSTNPTQPKPPVPNGNRPSTGDESNVTTYVVILILAILVAVAVLVLAKKKKNHKK